MKKILKRTLLAISILIILIGIGLLYIGMTDIPSYEIQKVNLPQKVVLKLLKEERSSL